VSLFKKRDRQGPTDLDAATLRAFRDHGSDLTRPRHVQHFLYFPDSATAHAAAAEIAPHGWECTVRPPLEGSSEFALVCEATTMADEAAVAVWHELFGGVAARHGGEHDGWEAAL
jgi:hypothetical protein